jgi:hypothetical protein
LPISSTVCVCLKMSCTRLNVIGANGLVSVDDKVVSLAGERDDGVDGHGLDGFAVRGDDQQRVALDGQLRGAHGAESVDHSEAVPASGGDGEHLQGGVGHQTGLRVPELAAAVDEDGVRVLSGTHLQASGEALGRVLKHHQVVGQVEVVQVAVQVPRRRLTHHDAALQTVQFLRSYAVGKKHELLVLIAHLLFVGNLKRKCWFI